MSPPRMRSHPLSLISWMTGRSLCLNHLSFFMLLLAGAYMFRMMVLWLLMLIERAESLLFVSLLCPGFLFCLWILCGMICWKMLGLIRKACPPCGSAGSLRAKFRSI